MTLQMQSKAGHLTQQGMGTAQSLEKGQEDPRPAKPLGTWPRAGTRGECRCAEAAQLLGALAHTHVFGRLLHFWS